MLKNSQAVEEIFKSYAKMKTVPSGDGA